MLNNLWGEAFEVEDNTKDLLSKVSNPKVITTKEESSKILSSKKVSVEDKLKLIEREVLRVLGKHVADTLIITTREELHNYITKAIENNMISIDTETNNSLDPITCKIMGLCLYTPSLKQAYVPINHVNWKTGILLENQLTEKDIEEELLRCQNVFTITQNGKFDYEVLNCTCNVQIPIDWDTLIATYVIDENERNHAGLKEQFITKIDSTQEKYDIEHLFEGVPYAYVDPKIFALYAATDSYMTYMLYCYQKKIFERADMKKPYKLFKEVEMPITRIVAKMELAGINIDIDYAKRLHTKYQRELDQIDADIEKELEKLQPKVEEWKKTKDAQIIIGKKKKYEQLTNPINLSSSTQMAIVFYDILGVKPINKKKPRSTDKATLDEIADNYDIPLAKLKKKRSGIKILLDTFIDKLPEVLNPKTHKIHAGFNQYGADTGRFSSRNPNAQNIPSKAHDIRAMFRPSREEELIKVKSQIKIYKDYEILTEFGFKKADKIIAGDKIVNLSDNSLIEAQNTVVENNYIKIDLGVAESLIKIIKTYKLIGSDYSAQEPRLTAFMSKDPTMLKAYQDGKDLYCVIAQQINHNKYEDNLEYYPEGTVIDVDGKKVICGKDTNSNAEGTKRRKQAKQVLLGITYGMGIKTLSERINSTTKEAQEILDNFFKGFPKVKQWIESSKEFARKYHYVEDFYGRRRHLTDMALEPYEVEYKDKDKMEKACFNPFLVCQDRKIDDKKVKKYLTEANKINSNREFIALQEQAEQDGIILKSNTNKIAQAERQSVNAIIQGGAATLTKLAMIAIDENERLKEVGFKMLLTIHDEVLGECPAEYADEVAELLPQIMVETASKYINVPMKCSPYNVDYWYEAELNSEIQDTYKELRQQYSKEESLKKLEYAHCEFTKDELLNIVS